MGLINRLKKFLHELKVELKKVHWPTRREFVVFFSMVISVVVVIGIFFSLLDFGFSSILEIIITR